MTGGALAGRRVLVTRRWPELVAGVAALGGTAVEVPMIELRPPDDPAPLDDALGGLAGYDWLVFTSANAVEAVSSRMAALGVSVPADVKIASVGPATTQAIFAAWPGVPVEVQPSAEFGGASLVAAFEGHELAGRRILLPVSDRAADTVERGLARRQARVDRIVAYRTTPSGSPERLLGELRAGVDALAFASPSAVEAFQAAVGEVGREVPVVAIGPTTAGAARSAGLNLAAMAEPSTVDGMLQALARAVARRAGS